MSNMALLYGHHTMFAPSVAQCGPSRAQYGCKPKTFQRGGMETPGYPVQPSLCRARVVQLLFPVRHSQPQHPLCIEAINRHMPLDLSAHVRNTQRGTTAAEI